jgi:YesN/AraC family two-component response regulator
VSYKVLIVEDESIVAEDLKNILEDLGHTVIGIFGNGRKALELAKENRPDFVMMDVRINGDLNGVETAIVLDSFFDQEIPFIFLSAHPARDYPVLKAITKYVYLNKPFNTEDLMRAIHSLGLSISSDRAPSPRIQLSS